MIVITTILVSAIKLLLIPSYRSTDFEVHRNWLAITHSLPLKKWYYDETSEWTLDYPPLFAYFEYALSFIAQFFDKNMLVVENLNYATRNTILFQRLSVIVSDLLYSYGTYKCCKSLQKSRKIENVLPVLLIANCGLLMIDHIHFQYNGFLYGILLISISYILQERHLLAAFWFSILINFKHIYIYVAPVYFIYLLRHYCLQNITLKQLFNNGAFFKRLFLLGSIVISVFLATFLPFHDQIGQVLSRMFPFKRGLCHAYWAPNWWVLYNVADKFLIIISTKLGLEVPKIETASMTGGLVQEYSHTILPNITPTLTIASTGVLMVPAMWKLYNSNKNPVNFLRCLVICSLTAFMFGWHVHEKAILMSIIPLSILSVMDIKDAKIFLLLSIVGHYSFFPLLFPKSLLSIKILLLTIYSAFSFCSLHQIFPNNLHKSPMLPFLSIFESLYIAGFAILLIYTEMLHSFLSFEEKYPFLPLLLTSTYCSLGVTYCWFNYYVGFLKSNVKVKKNK